MADVHHTKPCKNYNFQNVGSWHYFGLWLWKVVHLLNFCCSFQCGVLFLCLIKLQAAAVCSREFHVRKHAIYKTHSVTLRANHKQEMLPWISKKKCPQYPIRMENQSESCPVHCKRRIWMLTFKQNHMFAYL